MISFARILVLSLWAFSAVDRHLGRDESSITNGKILIDLDRTQQATSENIQNNLTSVDGGSLKESGASPFNLPQHQDQKGDQKGESDKHVCPDRSMKEPVQHLRTESLSNARPGSGEKSPQVNIANGIFEQKESAPIEAKPESIINRAGSNIWNTAVFALKLTIVFVSMPKASIQLLLWLQMGCLLCHFMVLRCGQLFARLRQRRDLNDIEHGGRDDPRPVVRLIYDTAHLVYQDITRWYRNNWKHLNDAADTLLLRFWAPQGELVRDPIEPGMLVPDPAQHVVDGPPNQAMPNDQLVWNPVDGPPNQAMPNDQLVWDPVDRHPEEAGIVELPYQHARGPAMNYGDELRARGPVEIAVQDPALTTSDAPATTAAVVAGAPPVQELFPTSIGDVCSRIKKGLGPEYAQLPPFSPTYFRLQRVVEFNVRSLTTATRGLDWTKKIDPLDVGMVTVVTVVQPNEDIDDVFKNGVSMVRLEVPSGTEVGEGNPWLWKSWLKPLINLLKAATPTLTSTTSNDGASKTSGGASENSDAKSVHTPLMVAASTLKSGGGNGSASTNRDTRRSKKKPATTKNKSDECASTTSNDGASKTSGGASENGGARSSTEKSAATDDWFVASVSELSDLNATKVSFDALHRLLDFVLWPAPQKMAFLFEVAGMIAVKSESDNVLADPIIGSGAAFLAVLDRDLAERERLCVFQWRVELVGGIWKEKSLVWIENSKSHRPLNDEELGPYRDQVGLLNTLWAEHTGGLTFKSLSLRVLRAIRNMDAHKDEKTVFVLKPEMWRLMDTLFPSLFPFVAGAVVHKLSELHHRSASSLSKGERWFLEHGTGAWTNAQWTNAQCHRCTMSPSIGDVKLLLNAVHQLGEARKAMCAVSRAEKVEVVK